jgi:hypothetical protein
MAGPPRYLWGNTKVDFLTFKLKSENPTLKKGRMYCDSDGQFRFCEDGTAFDMITLHN